MSDFHETETQNNLLTNYQYLASTDFLEHAHWVQKGYSYVWKDNRSDLPTTCLIVGQALGDTNFEGLGNFNVNSQKQNITDARLIIELKAPPFNLLAVDFRQGVSVLEQLERKVAKGSTKHSIVQRSGNHATLKFSLKLFTKRVSAIFFVRIKDSFERIERE